MQFPNYFHPISSSSDLTPSPYAFYPFFPSFPSYNATNFFPVLPQNQPQQPYKLDKQEPVGDVVIEQAKKQRGIDEMKKKNQKKRNSPKLARDEDFIQRDQACNRNLGSNTIKIYLKQVRLPRTQTFEGVKLIIQKYKLNYSVQQFMKTLQQYLPEEKNYISFREIRELASGKKTDENFSKIFRVSFRHFYLKDIYNVNIKSPRTTWSIRVGHIRKGREFIEELGNEFLEEYEIQKKKSKN